MKLIGIRTPKPKEYSYKPTYNDPQNGDRENRFRESGFSDNQVGTELRLRMQMRTNQNKLEEKIRKRSHMVIILFAVLLLLLALYYIFF